MMPSKGKSYEFFFRVWVHPEDGDPPEIEVWYHGLEETNFKKAMVSEWVYEAMTCEDFHEVFKLDKTKHWQVLGTAKIEGWFDYYGEYDESLEIFDFEKVEVPDSWFDNQNMFTVDS